MSILLLFAVRRWNRTLQRLYTDMRRHEAKVWGALLLLQLLVSLGGIAFFATHAITGNAANVTAAIIQLLTFGAKVTFFGFAFVWVRWTLPRFRYDQLMGLGWKGMLPLALANLFVTALVLLLID
jgi:NADH-quinone oxidoreductase subunit H